MIRLVRKSLVLGLMLAALVSLAQPAAVSAKHLQIETIELAGAEDHSQAPGEQHDASDHVHDVAQDVDFQSLPVVSWAELWSRMIARLPPPLEPVGRDRPPRASAAA